MKIVKEKISFEELKEISKKMDDLVKAVVDIDQEIMVVDAQMHADEEGLLLDEGSKQMNLWGINIHPFEKDDKWIEFDSMINVRPVHGNKSKSVEDSEIRNKIIKIVNKLVQKC